MRCHYLSDLHLERQDFRWRLPNGDVLIVAGDLCHARCLAPGVSDKYGLEQRQRVLRFLDEARSKFVHVLLIAGNHEHYDGVFDETAELLRTHLPGVIVLDNDAVDLGCVRFFGTTLWSDFEGRNRACMDGVRRRCGEFFFVKKRRRLADDTVALVKFQPEDALEAFDASMERLREAIATTHYPMIVASHHAPSRLGLNAAHSGNNLDGAFASELDARIAGWPQIATWIHGHTHVRCSYRIGDTIVRANCRGFDGRDDSSRPFSPDVYFDV